MTYKQLIVTCGEKPLGDQAFPLDHPGQGLISAARLFALTETDLRVEVYERLHDHPITYPKPCLTCPAGKLIRVWNGPKPTIMRSAAHAALLDLDPAFGKLGMTESMDRITDVLADFYSYGGTDLYEFVKAQVQS